MAPGKYAVPTGKILTEWVRDARERTFALIADLDDEQLMGPRLPIVNPLLWEIGHLAWFQEKWVLRHTGKQSPIRGDADALYDSAAVPHDVRWDLPLPSREETLHYLRDVRDRVLEQIERRPTEDLAYFVQLSVFHEDMHGEAFLYSRQTLGYRAPPSGVGTRSAKRGASPPEGGPFPGDVSISGGTFQLGAAPTEPFVFDNEKWAHAVQVQPFRMARAAVTQGEFAAFVEDGGYSRQACWSPEGWKWKQSVGAESPVYWRRVPGEGWQRRSYEQWVDLEPHRPVVHVNWYEADAYCRWAGRRLPTEVEWEAAAAGLPADGGQSLSASKRRFPWGNESPRSRHANLSGLAHGCIAVDALPDGDSAFGCRQLIGNVWEWTARDFLPYPGFVADPYKEYSQPWFGTHKVLRGGCWATQARLLRNTWRNFYTPDRRDVWAGFRTCALQA
jgi:gamma-glutamyl hercynylcysteine S-oxide synthase